MKRLILDYYTAFDVKSEDDVKELRPYLNPKEDDGNWYWAYDSDNNILYQVFLTWPEYAIEDIVEENL